MTSKKQKVREWTTINKRGKIVFFERGKIVFFDGTKEVRIFKKDGKWVVIDDGEDEKVVPCVIEF